MRLDEEQTLENFISKNVRCETCGFSTVDSSGLSCECDEVSASRVNKNDKCECYLFSPELKEQLSKLIFKVIKAAKK